MLRYTEDFYDLMEVLMEYQPPITYKLSMDCHMIMWHEYWRNF